MHALAFLLGSRALDLPHGSNPARQRRDDVPPPIASTPETAAAWRRWRQAGAVTEATRRPEIVLGNPISRAHPG